MNRSPSSALRRLIDATVLATSHERWFIALMAGVVGVYAGLAAGLFGSAINLVGLVLFHSAKLAGVLRLDAAWRDAFAARLETAPWNAAFLLFGLLAIAAALGLDRLVGARGRLVGLGPVARRFRLLAVLTAVGLELYYPLVVLRAFTASLGLTGGLAETVRETPWLLILLAPAFGGFASGWIVRRLTPRHLGHGVTEVMEAIVRDHGRIPAGVPLWKGLAAAICTGAGGSVGREGPIVQIGSGVGSLIGQRLGFSRANLTVLVGSGAAAGIAASFNAPIAGAIFGVEILLGDFGLRTFTPIVIASVMGTVVSRALLTGGAELAHASYRLVSGFEIAPYAALGLVCGLLSIAYIVTMERTEHAFYGTGGGRLGRALRRLPLIARPALGGLAVGALGLLTPRLLGTGYATMNETLRGELAGPALAAICAGKILAASLTLGSGGQGGSFFPATFIGAAGGGAFGALVHRLLPTMTAGQGAYALVGMGAVVAGATQGPLTGIMMMFELTGDYEIILPLMVACILATSLVQLVLGGGLYTRKLEERGIRLRAGRDASLLRALSVADAMTRDVETLRCDTPLSEVLALLSRTAQPTLPLLDAHGSLAGVVSLTDVRGALDEAEALRDLVRADDVAQHEVLTAFPDEDLETALERLELRGVDSLPVIDRAAPHRLVGLLSRREVLAAYAGAVRRTSVQRADAATES